MRQVRLALQGFLGVLALTAPTAQAHPTGHGAPVTTAAPMADAGAAKVVDAFHAALARADTAAAADFLTDAMLVFEAGGAERSKTEYASHHLPADAVFAEAVGSELTRRSGGASGNLAWVASEGRTKGRYKDRDVDQVTTETMVLQRVSGVWKIVHVHWSSRATAAKN